MAKAIKGITVEIGGDTTGLSKALKNIDTQSSNLQKELKQVEKLLKLDPTNTELISQKQQILAKSVETVETRLKALKDAQEKVEKAFSNNLAWEQAYIPLKKQIEDTRDKLDKLKSKETEMENRLKDGKISTEQYENYRKELENVEKEYQNLQKSKRDLEKEFNARGGHLDEEAYRSYQRELISTEQELAKLQEAHKDTTNSTADFSNQLSAVSSKCNEVANTMQPVTDKIVELGKEIYGTSTDFENSIAKLDVIADTDLSDGTGKSISELKEEILSLSDATGVASKDLANFTYDAISAGQKTANPVDFVSNATKLAKVGFTDTGTALDSLTTILNAYGLESEEASKISDMLLITQKEGKISVGELSQSIGKLIPTAQSAGVKVDQLCAGYIELTKNGVKATYATTYMNSMLDELNKTGSDTDNALKKMTATVQAVSDEQYEILENQYQQSEKSLDKSLESREKAVEKSYEQQSKDLEKAIERDIKAKEEELQQSIDLINEEYTEKLKLNDEEKYNALKAIDDQIDNINAQTDAEEKAIEERENNEKRLNLQNKINNAETIEDIQEAEKELYEFEENLALKQRKEERQAQIDALKSQKDNIEDEYDKRAEEIEKEHEEKVKAEEEVNSIILEEFEETQNKKLDKLDEQKERELEKIQETNEAEKNAWQEAWNEKLSLAKNGSNDGMGFAELIEDGYTIAEVLLLLQDYADQTCTSFNDLWSKTNARKSANILLNNADEYAEKLETVQNSEGAVDEALTKLDTTTAKVNKSFNRIKNSGIVLGSTMLDMVAPAIESLSGIIEKLTNAFNSLPTSVQHAIIIITTITALIAPVAMIISKISSGINTVIMILPTLTNIIGTIGSAISGLFGLIIANPVVAIIVGIVALLVILYNKCEGFRNFIDTFFGNFKENWELGMDNIVERWNNLKDTFSTGIVYIKQQFEEKVANIKGFFIGIFSFIVIKVSEFKTDIIDGIEYIKTSAKTKVDEFVDNWTTGFQDIKDFFSEIFNSLEEIAKTPLNAVLGLINSLINGINTLIVGINTLNIDVPDWAEKQFGIGDIGFNIPTIPNIPMLANGGILSSGSAIVGECGPELLTMMGNHAVVQPLNSSKSAFTDTKLTNQWSNTQQFNGTIEIPIFLYHGSSEFARAVVTANQISDCMNGGR